MASPPQIRTQQGVGSSTWTPPPFYGSLTIPDLYAFNAEHSEDHPVIVYNDSDQVVHTLYNKDIFSGMQKAATLVADYVSKPLDPGHADSNAIVGILAVTDFPTYFTLILGIMYLGYTPFPISTRNSAQAIAQLLQKTSTSALFVSADSAMQQLAQETKDTLAQEALDVHLLPLPAYGDLHNAHPVKSEMKRVPVVGDTPALILHSSGSTSFPKPIILKHHNLSRWAFTPYFGDVNMTDMMGILSITWPAGVGAVIAGFRPSSPPITPTLETVLNASIVDQCKGLVAVPSLIEAWARDPANLPALQSLDFLIFAGASLNREVGDMLVKNGVTLLTGYGATELGAVGRHMATSQPRSDGGWQHFELSTNVESVRIYQEGQSRVFELIILDCPTWSPNVFNTTVDGRPAYATSDLMEEHPAQSNLIRVFGRTDDQITLSTGEKTNPVPMEAALLQDINIAAAIIFGRERVQNGVIIQPKALFDPSDDGKLEAFRNTVW